MNPNTIDTRVCVIGDSDVGKTSFSMRYCHGKFPEGVSPTIGASFMQKRVTVSGLDVLLQIWDTAGQERFRSMAPMYYRGAKAAILVFDVTNEESYKRIPIWLRDLKAHADPEVVLVLAGNKCDKGEGFDLSCCQKDAEDNEMKFFMTSALTGEGIDEVFSYLSNSIVEKFKSRNKSVSLDGKTLDLNKKTLNEGTCCF